jgi:hypothetical protein
MKTKFIIMAIASIFILCGCGKSESKTMSKAEIRERIVEHYTQYGLPKEYILYKLGERSSCSISDTSVMLILQNRNQLDLLDYLDKDIKIYRQAK